MFACQPSSLFTHSELASEPCSTSAKCSKFPCFNGTTNVGFQAAADVIHYRVICDEGPSSPSFKNPMHRFFEMGSDRVACWRGIFPFTIRCDLGDLCRDVVDGSVSDQAYR